MAKAAVRDTTTTDAAPTRPPNGRRARPSADAREHDRALRQLEQALVKAARGDFRGRLPAKTDDALGRVEAAYNELAARNAALEAELVRVARIIGREGRMTERASLNGAEGAWGSAIGSVNGLIDDLVRPTTEVARVIVAVAEGDRAYGGDVHRLRLGKHAGLHRHQLLEALLQLQLHRPRGIWHLPGIGGQRPGPQRRS